jgi:hypothetical protein
MEGTTMAQTWTKLNEGWTAMLVGHRIMERNGRGAITPEQNATKRRPIRPTVVFIRDDGWTLAADASGERAARRLWAHAWIAEVVVQ